MTSHPDRFLDSIDVASPCSAPWGEMTGDERVRHCQQCRLNVYNLSEMTEAEATRLVTRTEGRLCVRFLRRADGTVLTRDCPVGFAALRRRARLAWARVAALLGVMCSGLFGCGPRKAEDPDSIMGRMQAPPVHQEMGEAIMGDMVCPPPPQPQPQPVMGKMVPATGNPAPPGTTGNGGDRKPQAPEPARR